MNTTEIIFWFLSAIALVSAIMLVMAKNPVHSVLSLIVTFFAISGHYILLNAQFLAIVNIIVYAGAIMVLFLFVVMLMNLNASAEPQKNRFLQFAGFISGGCLFLVIIAALIRSDVATKSMDMAGGDFGLIGNLGKVLFTTYVVPFEISSVLFLSAMIGAVVIGKREKDLN
ncbi:MAG TPA: NADH-quinone oxidoreductase subunit J [Ferruginibacter sp.]|nr:NADH-quinone oxidoreductase subunit J [Ferruginibacter sp.]